MKKELQPLSILAEFDGFRWLIRSDLDDDVYFHGRTIYEALGKLVLHLKGELGINLRAYQSKGIQTHPVPVQATAKEVEFMRDNIADGKCGSTKPDAIR